MSATASAPPTRCSASIPETPASTTGLCPDTTIGIRSAFALSSARDRRREPGSATRAPYGRHPESAAWARWGNHRERDARADFAASSIRQSCRERPATPPKRAVETEIAPVVNRRRGDILNFRRRKILDDRRGRHASISTCCGACRFASSTSLCSCRTRSASARTSASRKASRAASRAVSSAAITALSSCMTLVTRAPSGGVRLLMLTRPVSSVHV